MTQIAILTPAPARNVTPLLPSRLLGAQSPWEWYDRCLSAVGEVRYFTITEPGQVAGFDVVLVHEAIELSGWAIDALARLRERNGKVVWVEPHQRSTFAASVFEPGFFDAVDLVAKYQLMDYGALLAGLTSPDNNLAPWALYGHTSIERFYGDAHLFALPTSEQTLTRHLETDLHEHYGERIRPLMRLFSLARRDSWYGQSPSRQHNVLKESALALTLADGPSTFARGAIAALLAQSGLDVKLHRSSVRAAATSEACLALGPVHLDGSAADVLRFPTLAVLPEDPRYRIWDDVFIAGESYVPLTGYHDLLRAGGRVLDGEVSQHIASTLTTSLTDEALRARVMAGQREAYAKLADPHFVAAKLGVATAPAAPAAPTPGPASFSFSFTFTAPDPVPVRLGAISSDEVSVVIQGALGRDDLVEQVIASARVHLPGAEVVVSTWEGERELAIAVDRRVQSPDPGAAWQVHEEAPSNTNRLLVSSQAGLAAATRPYALKLRTDTPLSGTGFMSAFQGFPERSEHLALLGERIVVINYYCWNPHRRPFGLFGLADTVQFGRTEDVREVWARALDPEPATATWFETHARPRPDKAPWAAFRYTPEQLMWLGFLRRHIDLPFEHFCDDTPATRLLAELAMANNAIILEPDAFGVLLPKFAGREPLEHDALYSHAMWDALYDRYCLTAPSPAIGTLLSELQAGGASRHRLDELAGVAYANLAHPLRGGREVIILADAEELLEHEDMLATYAEVMGGCKRASLAIDASRLPVATVESRLLGLVARCGLQDRRDIDLLAVTGPQDAIQRRRMLRASAALYTRSASGDTDKPVFSPARAAELRAFVEGGTPRLSVAAPAGASA